MTKAFAAFSPGKQLMCDETRRWLADASVLRVDPVCEQDNSLISTLWTERERYGTLIISSRRLGLGARLRAGIITAKSVGKSTAKSLLRGGGGALRKPAREAKARPSSRPKKAKSGPRRRR